MNTHDKLKNDDFAPFENVRQRDAYWRVKRRFQRHLWRNVHLIVLLLSGLIVALGTAVRVYELRVDGELVAAFLRNDASLLGLLGGVWAGVLLAHFALVRFKDNEDKALEEALVSYRNAPPLRKQKIFEEEDIMIESDDYAHLADEYTDNADGWQDEVPGQQRHQIAKI